MTPTTRAATVDDRLVVFADNINANFKMRKK
jgi:hypothetical protein